MSKVNYSNYCATNNNRNQCSKENCILFSICKIKNVGEVYIGVSAWKEMGIKYGYDKFFNIKFK